MEVIAATHQCINLTLEDKSKAGGRSCCQAAVDLRPALSSRLLKITQVDANVGSLVTAAGFVLVLFNFYFYVCCSWTLTAAFW